MNHASEKYAEALFDAAKILSCVPAVTEEMGELDEFVKQCGEYLYSPEIGIEKKVALVREFLTGKISSLTLEFFIIMIRRRRVKYIPGVAEHFLKMSDNFSGKIRVHLRIPFEPDEETLKLFRRSLVSRGMIPRGSENEALITVAIEKDLIGGFILYCNGFQIDASLKAAITKLHNSEGYSFKED